MRRNLTRHFLRRSQEPILFNRGTTRLVSSNAAGISEEKKVTPQAWIQVCSVHNHPNAIPQSILSHALCFY